MSIGYMLVVLAFAGILGSIYSYFIGTDKIVETVSAATGGILGSIINIYSEFWVILESGIQNFFEPGYFGYSILVVGFGFLVVMLLIYSIITINENPKSLP